MHSAIWWRHPITQPTMTILQRSTFTRSTCTLIGKPKVVKLDCSHGIRITSIYRLLKHNTDSPSINLNPHCYRYDLKPDVLAAVTSTDAIDKWSVNAFTNRYSSTYRLENRIYNMCRSNDLTECWVRRTTPIWYKRITHLKMTHDTRHLFST